MSGQDTRLYKGFYYKVGKDTKLTKDEEAKIDIVKTKMDFEDPQQVLSIYNTVVTGDVFHTPTGYAFLSAVREYLVANEISEDDIRNVQMKTIFAPDILEENEKKRRTKESKKEKMYRTNLRRSLLVNVGLVIIVIAMFIIATTSDSPTIVNYKTKLNNSYASREQELREREDAVREKENELIKNGIIFDTDD